MADSSYVDSHKWGPDGCGDFSGSENPRLDRDTVRVIDTGHSSTEHTAFLKCQAPWPETTAVEESFRGASPRNDCLLGPYLYSGKPTNVYDCSRALG